MKPIIKPIECHVCRREIPADETCKTHRIEADFKRFVVACFGHSSEEVAAVPLCYVCGDPLSVCDKRAEENGDDECEYLAGK